MAKVQCYNCGSYKTLTYRQLWFWRSFEAFLATLISLVLIFTIPLMFITVPLIVVFFVKGLLQEDDKYFCKRCKFRFRMGSDKTEEQIK